jgi:hypothetical protein
MIDDGTLGVVAAHAAEGADIDALVVDAGLADGAVVVLDAGQLTTFVPRVAGCSCRAGTNSLRKKILII